MQDRVLRNPSIVRQSWKQLRFRENFPRKKQKRSKQNNNQVLERMLKCVTQIDQDLQTQKFEEDLCRRGRTSCWQKRERSSDISSAGEEELTGSRGQSAELVVRPKLYRLLSRTDTSRLSVPTVKILLKNLPTAPIYPSDNPVPKKAPYNKHKGNKIKKSFHGLEFFFFPPMKVGESILGIYFKPVTWAL